MKKIMLFLSLIFITSNAFALDIDISLTDAQVDSFCSSYSSREQQGISKQDFTASKIKELIKGIIDNKDLDDVANTARQAKQTELDQNAISVKVVSNA